MYLIPMNVTIVKSASVTTNLVIHKAKYNNEKKPNTCNLGADQNINIGFQRITYDELTTAMPSAEFLHSSHTYRMPHPKKRN